MTTKQKSKSAARQSAASKKTRKTAARKPSNLKLVWREIACRVRHTPNYISKGWSHIEISVVTPKGAPLPITQTGYRSHFLDADSLKQAGGPVDFFLDWIEREAHGKAWAKAEFKWRQGDLFETISSKRR